MIKKYKNKDTINIVFGTMLLKTKLNSVYHINKTIPLKKMHVLFNIFLEK